MVVDVVPVVIIFNGDFVHVVVVVDIFCFMRGIILTVPVVFLFNTLLQLFFRFFF